MFEQAFKNIDNVLRTDSGNATEIDYIEQTSWILFLKYLDDLEQSRSKESALEGKEYKFILEDKYRWLSWASPKGKDGKLDHQKALGGDDLRDFVDHELFPYLKQFSKKYIDDVDTLEYKIGQIFSEIKNKIQSGYALREILDIIDGLHFQTQKEQHELSHLYESKIQKMGNAGRNGGEYYTPRSLIKVIVEVVAPQLGEKIYDGAVGSAGFLVESFGYLTRDRAKLSASDMDLIQHKTLYGKEIKALAFIIGTMNMILHGIEAPNIKHMDTLSENIMDFEEKDRYDIVLANPPFGGKIRKEIQQNFPIKTGETAFLFLQHFIKILKAGGRAGIVIKNTFLSNTDNASVSLRKLLLESCNLHTVLDLPGGVFSGAGVKTVILFFTKGEPTKKVWYYQLNLARNLGKGNPLNESDLADFLTLQKTHADSPNSWSVDISTLDSKTFDLSVKNPSTVKTTTLNTPIQIIQQIENLNAGTASTTNEIKAIISSKI